MLNKNKIIREVLFLLLMCDTVFGQHLFAPGYFETHILPSDSGRTVFYLYRIPYNRFVFIKDGGVYKAGFRINIEVTDSITKHITRQIEEKSFSVEKFEETTSGESYFEGLCSFKLASGKYHLFPSISDLNSSKEFKLPEVNIEIDSAKIKKFIPPLVISDEKVMCSPGREYKLVNFNDSIPFSERNYDLIIPSADTALKSIHVILINNRDTVYKKTVNDSFQAGLLPYECDENIILKTDGNTEPTRNFIIKDFSNTLDEGALRVVISKDSGFKHSSIFNLDVKWINKPFSLVSPVEAIKFLKYIENNSVVDSLLSFDKDKYKQELENYWKKYDPKSGIKYNPLMDEYYSRIDYAMKNFSALSVKNGAETDRGKTYIKYGTPKKIERSSNNDGKIVEKWIYPDSSLVFEFIDYKGAGNYTLKK